ncbi:hypothetical protein AAHA92_27839 [Salvia divinorum]|uniref:Uncharacterized protein n=1 Tax=Salvia divinorum TaxID=28513 RepID=A0ABD1G815_SALDI
MAIDSYTEEDGQPRMDYTQQEIEQMLFDMQVRAAKTEKKMMSHKFKQENFARQEATVNRNLDDTLTKLTQAIH